MLFLYIHELLLTLHHNYPTKEVRKVWSFKLLGEFGMFIIYEPFISKTPLFRS